jgi:AraC family transcriptional regulator
MIIFIEKFIQCSATILFGGEEMPNDQYMLKALDFIDRNITQDISLYDICCEAGFSVPHFYRLFKRLTGDTVNAYILRRKLSMAAKCLLENNQSISSIAYEYGFESHDVFTRAFTRVYGVSPSKYRHNNGGPPLKRIKVLNSGPIEDNTQMQFSIFYTEGFSVIGMECIAKQWDCDGAIGRLWSDFLARIDEIKQPSKPIVMYGICEHETCANESFKYMAAIGVRKVTQVPTGMTQRFIKAQSFIQASVPDSISTPDAYTGTTGYARSLGYDIDDYDNIEVYNEVFQDPACNRFNLLIPIKG